MPPSVQFAPLPPSGCGHQAARPFSPGGSLGCEVPDVNTEERREEVPDLRCSVLSGSPHLSCFSDPSGDLQPSGGARLISLELSYLPSLFVCPHLSFPGLPPGNLCVVQALTGCMTFSSRLFGLWCFQTFLPCGLLFPARRDM